MIKRIICPTDFSDAAQNATEYAAKISQLFGAELYFVNVSRITPVAAAVSLGEGIGGQAKENAAHSVERLKDQCAEINKLFKISTDYEVDITTSSFEKSLTSLNTDNSIIVIGTNGADDMYQYLFGTHSFHIIKKATCPVMVIPENAFYGTIKKIAFAWGEELESNFSFPLFEELRKIMDPAYVFLHLSQRNHPASHEIYARLRVEVEKVLGHKPNVDFDQVFTDNVAGSIKEYMKKSGSDLLAINYYRQGPIADWYFTPAIRGLIETLPYPILVMPV